MAVPSSAAVTAGALAIHCWPTAASTNLLRYDPQFERIERGRTKLRLREQFPRIQLHHRPDFGLGVAEWKPVPRVRKRLKRHMHGLHGQ
jgi:hypothetical protein